MHGTDDHVCDINGSKLLMEKASTEDKTFIEMTGLFHEMYEDDDRDVYIPQLVAWVAEKAAAAKAWMKVSK